MTKINNRFKKMSKQKRLSIYGLIILAICILSLSIKATLAYYTHTSTPFSMLAALVGDFDTSSGDINIVIMRQTQKGGSNYVRTYGVPSVGYQFDSSRTECTNPSTKATVTCTSGSTGDCHYTYNANTREFALTSNQKVTCKFYFNQTISSDINVYFMIENDSIVDQTYNGKNYQLVNSVPASGYAYSSAVCGPGNTNMKYEASTRTVTVTSAVKNDCYVYFTKTAAANINTNVYVQETPNSEVYSAVESIPVGKIYSLNSKSRCLNKTGANANANITFDGEVNIEPNNTISSCDVYLDLDE